MASPFLGEIRIFGFTFAPVGWALCQGQLLPISQNTALFSLLGTNFGGDGTSTFGLPNFQGSAPMHYDQGPGLSLRQLGEVGGEATVTLIVSEIPGHTHRIACNAAAGGGNNPAGNFWAEAKVGRQAENRYSATAGSGPAMTPLQPVGGNLPHNNLPPYLVLNFCIALQGIFPARS